MGTAFLTCTESGAAKVVQEALVSMKRPTTLTRMFSGRLARAIDNQLTNSKKITKKTSCPFLAKTILRAEKSPKEKVPCDTFS
jgi:NAD(P)H-dependent flavin oxidoreductase YrpB (nitropropane dioxygenase family)